MVTSPSDLNPKDLQKRSSTFFFTYIDLIQEFLWKSNERIFKMKENERLRKHNTIIKICNYYES